MQQTLLRRILLAAGLILTFVLGVVVTRWFFKKTKTVEQESATVLLERVKTVAKLVTVEGFFSEIYEHQDYWGYDLSFLRKKALIRVKAKVSVGYDLEKMKFVSEPGRRLIRVEGVPPAEILSLEHDLDYYDVQEGMFNSFSTDDYNKLNANAKDFIRQKALDSELFKKASEQRDELLGLMRFVVESAGWALEIKDAGGVNGLDSLMK